MDTIHNMGLHPTTGDVYIVGYTDSTNLPDVADGYQNTFAGGSTLDASDVFVAHLSADLTTIHGVSYLGGTNDEKGWGLAFHTQSGGVYVTGETKSDDFPMADDHKGNKDVFVARLTQDLSELFNAVYYGGTNDDAGYALTYRPSSVTPENGDLYLAGYHTAGSKNALLLCLSPGLTTIRGTWEIGGGGDDVAYDLAYDSSAEAVDDRIYIVGYAGYKLSKLVLG